MLDLQRLHHNLAEYGVWSRMTAKAIRASLLASATATRLKGLVSISLHAQVRKALSCLDVYGPRPIATGLANSGPRVTTADVYPASLFGLSDHRREPRWIFARFPLNDAKALAETMPVQTPGSGSDGVTVSPSSANRCNC